MQDNIKSARLKVTALRLEAELIESTTDFSENPSEKTLNRLRVAKANKELFDKVTEQNQT